MFKRLFFKAFINKIFTTKIFTTKAFTALFALHLIFAFQIAHSACSNGTPAIDAADFQTYFFIYGRHHHDIAGIGLFEPTRGGDPARCTEINTSSILTLKSAEDLDPGEIVIFAHNNDPLNQRSSVLPPIIHYGSRLDRTWVIEQYYDAQQDTNQLGGDGVSDISIGFDISVVPPQNDIGNYLLLLNPSVNNTFMNNDFSDAAVISSGRYLDNDTLFFQEVPLDATFKITLLVNYLSDEDEDGVAGIFEDILGSDPLDALSFPDADQDGMTDRLEIDSDNDGRSNLDEYGADPFSDEDNDGIPLFLDPSSLDSSNNIIANSHCFDTDNDGVCDDFSSIIDSNNNNKPDFLDADVMAFLATDSDSDGLSDMTECPDTTSCPDNDNDGTPDYRDSDDDNDGINTSEELGNMPLSPADNDQDGLPNYLDTDDDNDGILSADETGDTDQDGLLDAYEPNDVDTDGDGLYNHQDSDDDNDNLLTANELGGQPLHPTDEDQDGIPDYLESNIVDTDNDTQFNHQDADDDGDSIITREEYVTDYFRLPDTDGDLLVNVLDNNDDNDTILTQDETEDTDSDALPDYLEPNNVDTDSDGLYNHDDSNDDNDSADTQDEIGIHPLQPSDTDADGLPDYLESDITDTDNDTSSNQNDADDDNDGTSTASEIGLDPFRPLDADQNGISDYLENHGASSIDSDGDGISDSEECPDSANCPDTDGDGTVNYLDLDDDNDNVNTADELGDTDGDGIPDYLEPNTIDTDGDSISNVNDNDDDNDQVLTSDEIGSDFLQPLDTDNDGIPNYLESNNLDSDNDDLNNHFDSDDDGDNIPTQDEIGSSPFEPLDTDNDGIPDYLDDDLSRSQNPGDNNPEDNNNPVQVNTDLTSGSLGLLSLLLVVVGALKLRLSTIQRTFIGSILIMFSHASIAADMWLDSSEGAQPQTSQQAVPPPEEDNFIPFADEFEQESQDLSKTDSDKPSQSSDQPAGSWYLGAGIGQSFLEPEVDNTSFNLDDDSDTSLNLFGGFYWTPKLRLEAHYSELGSASASNTIRSVEVDYSVLHVDAVYDVWRHQNFIALLNAGIVHLDTSSDANIDSELDTGIKIGAGIEYLMPYGFASRLAFDKYSGDTSQLSINLIKYFGTSKQTSPVVAEAPPEPEPVIALAPLEPEPAPLIIAPPIPPADSDQDSIVDAQDACPNTLPGLAVDIRGCGIFDRPFPEITFDSNSTQLTAEAKQVLDTLAKELRKVPDLLIEVRTHTDSQGSSLYNIWLSEKRADVIISYLAQQGIAKGSLIPKGYGKTMPIADNSTAEGRAQNRRAEFKVISATE